MRLILDRLSLIGCALLIVIGLAWLVVHPAVVGGFQIGMALVLVVRRWLENEPPSPRCKCSDSLHDIHPVGGCPKAARPNGYCDECDVFLQANAKRLVQLLRQNSPVDARDC